MENQKNEINEKNETNQKTISNLKKNVTLNNGARRPLAILSSSQTVSVCGEGQYDILKNRDKEWRMVRFAIC